MTKRIVWLVVSCLMVAALVLASCGQAEEEEVTPPVEEEEEVVPPGEEEEEEVTPGLEGPQYGGVLVDCMPTDPTIFDDALGHVYWAWPLQLTNEELVEGDWAKGPAGTGEASWLYTMPPPADVRTGELAESWDVVSPDHVVFHIRKGVRWHNKPPLNGREMTAEDIVFSLKRLWTHNRSYHVGAYPWQDNFEELNGGPWIEATDKWTVVVKTKTGKMGSIFPMLSDHSKIIAPEMIETYGDISKWENVCGTGPFMLVDYVAGSSMTFERHPNYWRKDPVGPGKGNQLPYLDGVKRLVITDASTRLSAMRTGKIDILGGYYSSQGWEDAESLLKTSPQLEYIKYTPSGTTILFWRIDREPFSNKQVRRALSMAIDRHEIADTLYGGTDAILTWPVLDSPEFADMYIPIEELAESTQEIYEYNPDKAKQLLAEAGYPDGFKTDVICSSTAVDLLAVVKDYWERIGVDLKIDVKEYAVYSSIGASKTYDQLFIWGANNTIPFRFVESRPGSILNRSMIDDPVMNEAYKKITAAYWDEPEARKLMKEVLPYILDQAYEFQFPVAPVYAFWQPWVENYHGEIMMGYADWDNYHGWLWLDLDLKEEMTGTR